MSLSHEHVGPKILGKIKIYVLTRAELLFPLCYEIPCITGLLIWKYHNLSSLCIIKHPFTVLSALNVLYIGEGWKIMPIHYFSFKPCCMASTALAFHCLWFCLTLIYILWTDMTQKFLVKSWLLPFQCSHTFCIVIWFETSTIYIYGWHTGWATSMPFADNFFRFACFQNEKRKIGGFERLSLFESTNSQFFFASVHENQPQTMGWHGLGLNFYD